MIPTKTPEKATVSISHHEGVVYDLGHTVGLPAPQWCNEFAGLWEFAFLIDASARNKYELRQLL